MQKIAQIKKRWQYLIGTLIILNIFLSSWWLINKDIHYNMDVARDFLVLKEIVETRQLTLIGPHTSMGGIFHGPLWYYMSLPAFFLTNGDPVLIGWFWWGLSILTLIIFWVVTKKLFNQNTALLATLLYSANSITNPAIGYKQFFNPYGAVMLSPVFFYLLSRYIDTKKSSYLLLTLVTIGLLIQFQVAFGIPILVLVTLFLAYFLFTRRLLKHWFVYPVILLPLSTFIIFDLRHNLLQFHSFIKFLSLNNQKVTADFIPFLYERIQAILTDTYFLLTLNNRILAGIAFLLFVFLVFKVKSKARNIYNLFLYFYLGFWGIFFFSNISFTTYYWPFLPIIIMLYCAYNNYIPKKIFLIIYISLLIYNYYIAGTYIKSLELNIDQRRIDSWAFNEKIAEIIYEDAKQSLPEGKGDFGYYIYTPYLWVYKQWYSMDYAQRKYKSIIAHPFTKQRLTYLIIVDDNPNIFKNADSNGWKITHIKIKQEPEKVQQLDVVEIQKYYLTDEEIKIPANPYLLNSTFFR